MLNRLPEFLEGENRILSMARLLTFMSWFPATGVVVYLRSTEALSVYLGAFVLNSVANKGIDAKYRNKPAVKNIAKDDA